MQTKTAGKETLGDPLYRKTHLTIKKVTEDIEREFHFNTAVAALMEMVNEMYDYISKGIAEEKLPVLKFAIETLVLLISPFAPHFSEELWEILGNKSSIANASWPEYDPEAIVASQIELVIQVNGKVKSKLMISAALSDEDIKKKALEETKIKDILFNRAVKKVFVVKGKLVNIVI